MDEATTFPLEKKKLEKFPEWIQNLAQTNETLLLQSFNVGPHQDNNTPIHFLHIVLKSQHTFGEIESAKKLQKYALMEGDIFIHNAQKIHWLTFEGNLENPIIFCSISITLKLQDLTKLKRKQHALK
jgi:hypothetical protein